MLKVEEKIGGIFEKEHALLTQNGTTAIWLLLAALGIKGKKVILPANICFVVVCAVILSGNEPSFVDIDGAFSLDPEELKDIASAEAAAVIFPHMYGNVGRIEEVVEIAQKKKWVVIEDAAQALGAKKGARYAGSFADFAITSFGMGKIIDANAGGILSVNSRRVYDKAKEIYAGLPLLDENKLGAYLRFNQLYGALVDCLERGDDVSGFGRPLALNYRDANLSRLPAAWPGLEKLEDKLARLEDELKIRADNAGFFRQTLKQENVRVLAHGAGATYWRQNVLAGKDRDGLLKYLKENKVKASKYFPAIDGLFISRKGGGYPEADKMAAQIINLWPGRETSREDIVRINELIGRYYQGNSHAQ